MSYLEPMGSALCGPQAAQIGALLVSGLEEIHRTRTMPGHEPRIEIGTQPLKLSWGAFDREVGWRVAWILVLDRQRLRSKPEILMTASVLPGVGSIDVREDPRGWYKTVVRCELDCGAVDDGRVQRLIAELRGL